MSLSSARVKAAELKVCYLDHGVPEVSIELQAGRPNIYDEYDAMMVVAKTSHHTVSAYRPTSLTPVLALCKKGRSDVPGPLCNTYGGWDLTLRILTFGYANHPGAGGPYRVPRIGGGTYTIPLDSARRYAWGTEFEGGIREADWDLMLRNPRGRGKPMTFREFMGRVNAADLDYFGVHPDAHMEHRHWTEGRPKVRSPRKVDRIGYVTLAEGKAELLRYADPNPDIDPPTDGEELDMTPEEVKAATRIAIVELFIEAAARSTTSGRPLRDALDKILVHNSRVALHGLLDEAANGSTPTGRQVRDDLFAIDGIEDEQQVLKAIEALRAAFAASTPGGSTSDGE
jgi:hypothetical protein